MECCTRLFKRGDPGRVEEEVLMRALRDFNIPKIISDDVPVFMGLIGDLFPSLDVPRKRDQDFEKTVKQAAVDLLLQPEENFILKVHCNNNRPVYRGGRGTPPSNFLK